MDIVDEYMAFKKMTDKPPSALRIGQVKNMDSVHYKELELETPSNSQCSDEISVSLGHFLDGIRDAFPRVYHNDTFSYENAQYIPLFRMDTTYFSLSTNIDHLISIAHPSPFGDIQSGQTKTDTEVRYCLQIVPEVDDLLPDNFPDTMRDQIQSTLYPNREIILELNKINIYPEGGHFKPHLDTPKPGVIGSLVVFGPSPFEGGDLVIDDNGTERHYNTGIVAFYSSMPHWVEPVLSGTRVTATYYIKEDNSDEEAETEPPPPPLLTILETLRKQSFGVILSELYSKLESGVLKGEDRKLQDLLSYFNVEYYPVIVKYHETYYDNDDDTKFKATVFRATEQDFLCYKNNSEYETMGNLRDVDCYVIPERNIGGHQLGQFRQNYADHVGNDCQEGIINNTYFSRLAVFRPLPLPPPLP
jgi:hypothetical protein